MGLVFRTLWLDRILPNPDWDEVSTGWNAYSIIKTGSDEWGVRFPLLFRAFGDYKLPLYIYLVTIPIRIFGLSIFSVRIISALIGTLSILFVFVISHIIWKDSKKSLFAALLMAASPYSVVYSRIGLDMILASGLILLAILSFMQFVRKRIAWLFIVSLCALVISLFAHNLARVIAPLLLAAELFIGIFYLKKTKLMLVAIIPICIGLGIVFLQFRSGGLSRMKQIGLFGEQKGAVIQIREFREDHKNNLYSRLTENKASFYFLSILEQYIGHFSPIFLTQRNDPRISQQGYYPPLYTIMLPFYFIGLLLIARNAVIESDKTKRLLYLFFAAWILVSPFPSVITDGAPLDRRYLGALGTFEILCSYGFFSSLTLIAKVNQRKIAALLVGVVLCFEIGLFVKYYFGDLPRVWDYRFGFESKSICEYLKSSPQYRVIVSHHLMSEPQVFTAFCTKFDPKTFQETRKWEEKENWFFTRSYGRFFFPDTMNEAALDHAKDTSIVFVGRDEYLLAVTYLRQRNIRFVETSTFPKYGTDEEKDKKRVTMILINK